MRKKLEENNTNEVSHTTLILNAKDKEAIKEAKELTGLRQSDLFRLGVRKILKEAKQ